MSNKFYRQRLVFLINILGIVPLGYTIRFSQILPAYFPDAGGSFADEIV